MKKKIKPWSSNLKVYPVDNPINGPFRLVNIWTHIYLYWYILDVNFFIWASMKTVAWEIVAQIILRDCSREIEGKDSIYVILVKWEYM